MLPRTDLALEFLKKWSPIGPWVLTAISAEKRQIETKTFRDIPLMESWINAYNGTRNLYFTINPIRHDMDTKPSKADILEMVAFQVDADPRVGEDFEGERERILKSFMEFVPHPSVIVDSGGGFQAFWLLDSPIPLDGSEITASQFEAYSVQLELLLHGDRTSNCDRVFRLPGTINIPDAGKLKKGRKKALAKLVEWKGTRYPVSAFTKAPTKIQSDIQVPGQEVLAGGGEKITLSGNISPVYVEDLPSRGVLIPDLIKVLIVHGVDPDHPNKYASRSEPLFAVCCALARAGADNDTIAGVIMNRDNKISESVLDKPRPGRYATKQIQDAREEIEDPVLRQLNSKHAVIGDVGGKCRIVSEVFEYALNRPRISFSSFDDFRNRYLNVRVQVAVDAEGKPIYKPAGGWWVAHPQRRQYETIVFAPGRDIPQAYNLWQGFACEAIPGDCGLFTTHIRQNICQGNEEYYTYLLGWMARCVQRPDCPGEVAVVLRGEMGTGKSLFAKMFGSLFGRHFLQVSDPKHLVGSFNSHLRDCVVLFGDEAFYAGDKKHESVLKALVTEETLAIESKGVDVVASPNYTHIILASNSNWVVPAGSNERRYFALDVSMEKMQNKKYFSAILEQMASGGREALLHMLLTHNISTFEVREVPKTAALQDQKMLSMASEETWWFEKLEEGRLLKDHNSWEREVMKESLQEDYILSMQRVGQMRKASATVLGKFLATVCPKDTIRSYQRMAKIKKVGHYGEEYTKNGRVYFYEFPPLEICRSYWDTHFGGPFKWNEPLDKGEQIEMQETVPESVFK